MCVHGWGRMLAGPFTTRARLPTKLVKKPGKLWFIPPQPLSNFYFNITARPVLGRVLLNPSHFSLNALGRQACYYAAMQTLQMFRCNKYYCTCCFISSNSKYQYLAFKSRYTMNFLSAQCTLVWFYISTCVHNCTKLCSIQKFAFCM